MNKYEQYLIANPPPIPPQVGSKVMISPNSKYYGRNAHNPADVIGIVYSIIEDSALGIVVEWSNDTRNSYNPEDLIVIG